VTETERRAHPRRTARSLPLQVSAKLRTGAPLRIIDLSPDGLLVETTVRMLPGHEVDLVLQSESGQETRHCHIVHSRVAAIIGAAGLRYRAGLHLHGGSRYSPATSVPAAGHLLPAKHGNSRDDTAAHVGDSEPQDAGTIVGNGRLP